MSHWSKAAIATGNPSAPAKVYEVELGLLPEYMVALKMLMASINPSDKAQCAGLYPEKKVVKKLRVKNDDGHIEEISGFIGGIEGVAQVTEIGSGPDAAKAVNGDLKVGDWVVPQGSDAVGTWTDVSYANAKDLILIRNTKGLTPEQVGAVKINAATSYRMLKDIIKLNSGEYIIQNAANSGVGQIIIQLAHLWGYKTINIVRDRSNFAELEAFLKKLGADIVLKDSDLDSDKSKELIASLDAPVALGINAVNGPTGTTMSQLLSFGGTYVTYGSMTKEPISVSPFASVFQDIRFFGFWIGRWYRDHPQSEWIKMWDEINDLFREGKLKHQKMNQIRWAQDSQSLDKDALQKLVDSALNPTTKEYFKF